MPVISPRRSSTSGSGSLYGTTSSSTGGSSPSSAGSSGYSSAASYLNRASSLSKTSSSAYNPSFSSYLSAHTSYSPRLPSHRSSLTSSSYLSGGSSGLGTYRSTSSYLGSGFGSSSNDSTTSSRYGLIRKSNRVSDTLKRDANGGAGESGKGDKSYESKKPPSGSEQNKRLSGSYSSSSLARLVATSGVDIYEKYSPAHYKPNCELPRSRSALSEADVAATNNSIGEEKDKNSKNSTKNASLDRPRSRYSRLYSNESENNDVCDNAATNTSSYRSSSRNSRLMNSSSASSVLSNSSSYGDIPTATFTLRCNRLNKAKARDDDVVLPAAADATLKNGVMAASENVNGNNGIGDTIETAGGHLKDLKLSTLASTLNVDDNINSSFKNNNNDVSGYKAELNAYNIDSSSRKSGDVSTTATLKLETPQLTKTDKQKCEPVVQIVQNNSRKVAAANTTAVRTTTLSAAKQSESEKTSSIIVAPGNKHIQDTKSGKTVTAKQGNILRNGQTIPTVTANGVRAANQQFFLVPAFKDQNFLKEECELAHAQVTNKTDEDNGSVGGGTGEDNRNNNNTNSNQRATASGSSAVVTNGMRRSGNGNTSHLGTTSTTSATVTTVHKVDIVFNQFKALQKTPKSSPATKLSNASSSSRQQVKPLIHRTIPSTAQTIANAVTYSNKLNNNTNNGNGNINHNNIMQHPCSESLLGHDNNDHDDIKYIDSDDTPTSASTSLEQRKCEQRRYIPQASATTATTTAKTRVRPKSTIICSSPNSLVFEKVNNYKYANGNMGNTTTVESSSSFASRRRELRHSGIDSNSIKASIEKFNSFSEQRRLPLSVTLRSHAGSGSTSNLQHHRHSSSEFDNCNLCITSSGGGSLTRSPYRTASASNTTGVVTAGITASKIITSMHTTASVTSSNSSSLRTVAALSTSGGSSTNSLPTKLIFNRTPERASASSVVVGVAVSNKGYAAAQSTTATIAASGKQQQQHDASTETKKVGMDGDSVRSSTIRRDRDISGRTSSTLSSAYNNTDDASKSTCDEKSEGLCGLRNIGNTCFMNSVIQCLSHTSELTKFLRTHNGLRSSSSKDQLILHEFAKLIREMWTSNVRSVTPMELKRAFSTKHRMYSDYNQQDAQEFLRFFLDSLHSALNTGVKGEHLKIDDNLSDNKKADMAWEWHSRHENSLIRDLFVGQLKSALKCTTCGNTSVTFDPFWDLSVPLPSSSRCKLDSCLDLFIREEILDGDEMPTCAKCRARRRCTKSFTIQRFPKYLVIHLKRFSETRWSKLSNIVEFPTGERELNMGPYGSNSNINQYYSLYAISNHMGSTAGGHYVALCKHPVSKKWHEFNDNIVSEALSENHLVSSSAYILFYERA